MRLGHEEQAETRCSARRRLRPAAVGQGRAAGRVGLGCHPDPAAVDLDLFSGPEPPEQRDAILDQCGPLPPVDPEHGELLGPVPDAHDVGDTAPADQVDDREILGQLDRFVERQEERGDVDGHGPRSWPRWPPRAGSVRGGTRPRPRGAGSERRPHRRGSRPTRTSRWWWRRARPEHPDQACWIAWRIAS